jgi:hypothetical protein
MKSVYDEQSTGAARPVKTFKQGGVEVGALHNSGKRGERHDAGFLTL